MNSVAVVGQWSGDWQPGPIYRLCYPLPNLPAKGGVNILLVKWWVWRPYLNPTRLGDLKVTIGVGACSGATPGDL